VLSRIAESLFWIGRYVERADATARIIDVQTQLMVEDPLVREDTSCRRMLDVMGVRHDKPVDDAVLVRLLLHDFSSSASVAATLSAARESARRARETLSTEMWSALNTTWHSVSGGRLTRMRTPAACAWVRERCALITGIADSTMSRDQGWHFLVLGRNLERVDMTARLLTATALSGAPGGGWQAALRACGAHEAFLRSYRGLEADPEAAEFLLLDRLFPRSVMAALTIAQECLVHLDSENPRVGFGDDAQRILGRARADLQYRPFGEVLTALPGEMRGLQATCSAAAEAITERYFAVTEPVTWAGGLG
jgi:uncharacterized alpha-E superfamily protein